ncbi:MAG: methylation-associated defense system AAA family ATPase MAD3 [bacterium]
MITLIEALGYRCLRYIRQPLDPFHVLVGPNASGKTTFLDVIAFLGRLVSDGPDAAIEERTQNFYDLVWRGEGTQFELAIEARIPDGLRGQLRNRKFDTIRYEVTLAFNPATQQRGLSSERALLTDSSLPPVGHVPARFPKAEIPITIQKQWDAAVWHVLTKDSEDVVVLRPETFSTTLVPPFKLAPRRSALGILFAEETSFPVSIWLKELLASGVQQLVLNSQLIRRPSPSGQGPGSKPDGSNLPWVVADLRQRSPDRFRQWIAHLQTAFPDLQDIKTVERPEDRHRYLMLTYGEGLEVPSWMASDGTLRMLALTLPAYLEDFKGIYLIEEPENGIHPRAIETMTQSLSSVYNAQVLLATHSPVILSTVEAEQILCFAKTPEGATDIVRGSEHPALQSWKHETTLGTLFAAGVLG